VTAGRDLPPFGAVLRRHAALHDLAKPLVRADYVHALDVWRWAVTLDPAASFELQVAALFHDVERLESEADRRIEQHAPDLAAFKRAHAARGAAIASAVLGGIGVPARSRERIAVLIARHEETCDDDEEVRTLNDADALSFITLNAPGFLRYHGPERTRRKVRTSLARLSPRGLARLARVALEPEIAALAWAEAA
jgi:hypothetical protein